MARHPVTLIAYFVQHFDLSDVRLVTIGLVDLLKFNLVYKGLAYS